MGNKVSKKVVAYLEDRCSSDMEKLLGSRDRSFFDLSLINEAKAYIEKAKANMPKRMIKYVIRQMFEDYNSTPELDIYVTLLRGKPLNTKTSDPDLPRSLLEYSIQTRHLFMVYLLLAWQAHVSKSYSKTDKSDTEDLFKKAILDKLESCKQEVDLKSETNLLQNLLKVAISSTSQCLRGEITMEIKKNCKLLETTIEIFLEKIKLAEIPNHKIVLSVQKQLTDFIKCLIDAYSQDTNQLKKQQLLKISAEMASIRSTVTDQLQILHALYTNPVPPSIDLEPVHRLTTKSNSTRPLRPLPPSSTLYLKTTKIQKFANPTSSPLAPLQPHHIKLSLVGDYGLLSTSTHSYICHTAADGSMIDIVSSLALTDARLCGSLCDVRHRHVAYCCKDGSLKLRASVQSEEGGRGRGVLKEADVDLLRSEACLKIKSRDYPDSMAVFQEGTNKLTSVLAKKLTSFFETNKLKQVLTKLEFEGANADLLMDWEFFGFGFEDAVSVIRSLDQIILLVYNNSNINLVKPKEGKTSEATFGESAFWPGCSISGARFDDLVYLIDKQFDYAVINLQTCEYEITGSTFDISFLGFDFLNKQIIACDTSTDPKIEVMKNKLKITFISPKSLLHDQRDSLTYAINNSSMNDLSNDIMELLGFNPTITIAPKTAPESRSESLNSTLVDLSNNLTLAFINDTFKLDTATVSSALLRTGILSLDSHIFDLLIDLMRTANSRQSPDAIDCKVLAACTRAMVECLRMLEYLIDKSKSLQAGSKYALVDIDTLKQIRQFTNIDDHILINPEYIQDITSIDNSIFKIAALCDWTKDIFDDDQLSSDHLIDTVSSRVEHYLSFIKVYRKDDFKNLIEDCINFDKFDKNSDKILFLRTFMKCFSLRFEDHLEKENKKVYSRFEDSKAMTYTNIVSRDYHMRANLKNAINAIFEILNFKELEEEQRTLIFGSFNETFKTTSLYFKTLTDKISLMNAKTPDSSSQSTTSILNHSIQNSAIFSLVQEFAKHLHVHTPHDTAYIAYTVCGSQICALVNCIDQVCLTDTDKCDLQGYKLKKEVELSLSVDASVHGVSIVELDPDKEYLLLLDGLQQAYTGTVTVLRPVYWSSPIADCHEYQRQFMPCDYMNFENKQRIVKVAGSWMIALYANKDRGNKEIEKVKVKVFARSAFRFDPLKDFVSMHLNLIDVPKIVLAPYLGERLVELPSLTSDNKSESKEITKEDYLKSLKLETPINLLQVMEFKKSSLTIENHSEQIKAYSTKVDKLIDQYRYALRLIQEAKPLLQAFTFAGKVLKAACDSVRLKDIRSMLIKSLIKHPHYGWPIIKDIDITVHVHYPELIRDTCCSLLDHIEYIKKNKETAVAFFELLWQVLEYVKLNREIEGKIPELETLMSEMSVLAKSMPINQDIKIPTVASFRLSVAFRYILGDAPLAEILVNTNGEDDEKSATVVEDMRSNYISSNGTSSDMDDDNNSDDEYEGSEEVSKNESVKKSENMKPDFEQVAIIKSMSSSYSDSDENYNDDSPNNIKLLGIPRKSRIEIIGLQPPRTPRVTSLGEIEDIVSNLIIEPPKIRASKNFENEFADSPLSPLSIKITGPREPSAAKKPELIILNEVEHEHQGNYFAKLDNNIEKPSSINDSHLDELKLAIDECPYFNMTLLPPSTIPLLPTLACLSLPHFPTASNPTLSTHTHTQVYHRHDSHHTPYIRMHRTAGGVVAAVRHDMIEHVVKYMSKIECPRRLWFDVYGKDVLIAVDGRDIVLADSCDVMACGAEKERDDGFKDEGWLGLRVYEALRSNETRNNSSELANETVSNWRLIGDSNNLGLLMDSSHDLWKSLRDFQMERKVEDPTESKPAAVNKFAMLRKKLSPPIIEKLDRNMTDLPIFPRDKTPNINPTNIAMLPRSECSIKSELLSRLTEELVAYNIDNLDLQTTLLEDITISVYTRFSVLEQMNKSVHESCTTYRSILLDKLTPSNITNICHRLVANQNDDKQWVAYGCFRLIKEYTQIQVKLGYARNIDILKLIFETLLESICMLTKKQLDSKHMLRLILIESFEYCSLILDTSDSSWIGLADSRAAELETLIGLIGAAHFEGYMNSQDSIEEYLDGLLNRLLLKNILSSKVVDAMTLPDAVFMAKHMIEYKKLAIQSTIASPEEFEDTLVRGILMNMANNEKSLPSLPDQTKYLLTSRLPLKIRLPGNYPNYALRDVQYEQTTGEEEEVVFLQMYQPEKKEKTLQNVCQQWTSFNQFELCLPKTMPVTKFPSTWPEASFLLDDRNIVVTQPPVSRRCFMITHDPDSDTYELDRQRMDWMVQYFTADSKHNPRNCSIEGSIESMYISGLIYTDGNLQDSDRINVWAYSDESMIYYSPCMKAYILLTDYKPSLVNYLRNYAESDKVYYQIDSPTEAAPLKIVCCDSLRYLILLENEQMMYISFNTEYLDCSTTWQATMADRWRDAEWNRARKYEIDGMTSDETTSCLEPYRELYSFVGEGLIDFEYIAGSILLIFDKPANLDNYECTLIWKKDCTETFTIRKSSIVQLLTFYEDDKKFFIILHSDGTLTCIDVLESRGESKPAQIYEISDRQIQSIAVWQDNLHAISKFENDGMIAEYEIVSKIAGISDKLEFEKSKFNRLFKLDSTSLIHTSPQLMATNCDLDMSIVFDQSMNSLLDYPLCFWLDQSTGKLQFKSLAGNADFYQEFLNHDIGRDTVSILVTGPFTMTMCGNELDNYYDAVESFLDMYMRSDKFIDEDPGSILADRIITEWKDELKPVSEQIDFSGPSSPKVVVRLTGKVKQEYKALISNVEFTWVDEQSITFEIMPNLLNLRSEPWKEYKILSKPRWEELYKSLTLDQWWEIKKNLVEQTWNIDFDENPYPAKVYEDAQNVNKLTEELTSVKDKIPYFTRNPDITVSHLLATHCSIAMMDYWYHQNYGSLRFVRDKPVERMIEKIAGNTFGTSACEMRFQHNYSEAIGSFELQVDRYRAELCTSDDQNMSLVNQVYYQVMYKLYWNMVSLKKLEGIELNFVGEDGLDGGGLLKEYFSKVADEVTNRTGLFVKSPNFGATVEENDRYIPNPSRIGNSDQMSFLRFGFILGLAYKMFGSLPIDLPSCFWEHLLGFIILP